MCNRGSVIDDLGNSILSQLSFFRIVLEKSYISCLSNNVQGDDSNQLSRQYLVIGRNTSIVCFS